MVASVPRPWFLFLRVGFCGGGAVPVVCGGRLSLVVVGCGGVVGAVLCRVRPVPFGGFWLVFPGRREWLRVALSCPFSCLTLLFNISTLIVSFKKSYL